MKNGNPEEFLIDPDDAVRAMLEEDDIGWCCGCGHEQIGVDPDGYRLECEECGAKKVYGYLFIITFALRGEDLSVVFDVSKEKH